MKKNSSFFQYSSQEKGDSHDLLRNQYSGPESTIATMFMAKDHDIAAALLNQSHHPDTNENTFTITAGAVEDPAGDR
jgi:hypothetical protein